MSYNSYASSLEQSVTSSAIFADAVSGSHILRIHGYSRTKGQGLGNGRHISSTNFTVGGHRWCLQYYPDGHSPFDSDWMSFMLHCDGPGGGEAKASFTISLLDQGWNPVPSYTQTSPLTIFSGTQGTMGYNLIKRSDLERSVYLQDDVFRVRCDVTVAKPIVTRAVMVPAVVLRRV